MAPLSSKLPEIMAQISKTLADSFATMAETLFTRLQTQEKELVGEATKDINNIKTEIAGFRKDLGEVKQEVIKAQPVPPPVPITRFEVPQEKNMRFVGRDEELGRLFELWKPGKKGRIAVVGLGGSGKTALVTEFVYRINKMSTDTSIFWFKITTEIVEEFSSRLNDGSAAEPFPAGSLIILDFDDYTCPIAEGMTGKWQEFKGCIISLTRNAQDSNVLAGPDDFCELHGLKPDASISLLRECLGLTSVIAKKATEDQLLQVVQSMAGSPRAIIQISRLLSNSGMDVSQLLNLYQESEEIGLRLFSRPEARLRFPEETSIISRGIFDVKAFRVADRGPARILFQLYFLGGTSIPFSIFKSDDRLDFIISLGSLKANFLLSRSDSQSLTIHPLVFMAIKKTLESDGRKADDPDVKEEEKWRDEILKVFSEKYPNDKHETTWWADWYPSIISGLEIRTDSQRVAVAMIYDKESKISLDEGDYLNALRLASKATEALPDPIPAQQLYILENKLSILNLLAKYRDVRFELEKYHHEKLPAEILLRKQRFQAKLYLAECSDQYDSALKLLNGIRTSASLNDSDRWRSMTDYAIALIYKGNYKEAEGQSRDALAMQSKHLGLDHRDSLTSAHVLAEVLGKAGRFDEATHHIQRAFQVRKAALGARHLETLHSKMIFASILFAKALTLGDFEEAAKLLIDCSTGFNELAERHPLALTSDSILAMVLSAQGKSAASEKLNDSVLAERQSGPWQEPRTHPDTLQSMQQLVEIFRLGGRLTEADERSKFILEERTRVLTKGTQSGTDFHPDQLTSFHQRAIVLSLRGSHTTSIEATKLHGEAVKAIEIALKGRRAILGPDHPAVFLAMTWKGEILRAEQRSQLLNSTDRTAKLNHIDSLHEEALKRLTLVFGPEHRHSLQCKINLAAAKLERGRETPKFYMDAQNLYSDCFAANCRNLGDLHPETLKCKTSWARSMKLSDPKRHEEAKKLWREACAGLAKVFGLDGVPTVTAYKEYEEFFAADKRP